MSAIRFIDCVDLSGESVKPYDGSRFFLNTGALHGSEIDSASLEDVTYFNRPSRANVNVSIGDIIFAKMQSTIKVLKITEATKDLIVSTGFFVIRPHDDVDDEFIFQYLSSKEFNEQKDQNCTGATQKALTNTGLKNITIPCLSFQQQQQIGKALSGISEVINIRREQLSVLEKLELDTFIDMFGDPLINLKGWAKYPLNEKCEIITGNTPPRSNPGYYGTYIEWIKSDNINTNNTFLTKAVEYLSEDGAKRGRIVKGGSVLMTCIAGSLSCIGNVAIADRQVAFNQQINAIVPGDDVDVFFLYFMLRLTKPYIQSDVNMSLKGIVNKGKLSSMSFIFPPIDEQVAFSNIVQRIETQKARLQASLVELETIYKSTLQMAFNGELFQ